MADNSSFKSRAGKLSCTPEVLYNFITDIRNLEQFVPKEKTGNWIASSDSCSFSVPPLGSANVRISAKVASSLVEFTGDIMKSNNFMLKVNISGNEKNLAEVRILLTADLNPVLRIMASGPIEKFLEMLISEMEKYEKWNMLVK
jgi:hypothetical protein